jgi:hypothetical protein
MFIIETLIQKIDLFQDNKVKENIHYLVMVTVFTWVQDEVFSP